MFEQARNWDLGPLLAQKLYAEPKLDFGVAHESDVHITLMPVAEIAPPAENRDTEAA